MDGRIHGLMHLHNPLSVPLWEDGTKPKRGSQARPKFCHDGKAPHSALPPWREFKRDMQRQERCHIPRLKVGGPSGNTHAQLVLEDIQKWRARHEFMEEPLCTVRRCMQKTRGQAVSSASLFSRASVGCFDTQGASAARLSCVAHADRQLSGYCSAACSTAAILAPTAR